MAVRPLYSGTPPVDAAVAFGRGRTRSQTELAAHAGALASAIDAAGRGRWLVYTEDSYAAAVSLVALTGAAILYQTQTIIREFPVAAHVAGALALFSSVMTLFWYILQLVGVARD